MIQAAYDLSSKRWHVVYPLYSSYVRLHKPLKIELMLGNGPALGDKGSFSGSFGGALVIPVGPIKFKFGLWDVVRLHSRNHVGIFFGISK